GGTFWENLYYVWYFYVFSLAVRQTLQKINRISGHFLYFLFLLGCCHGTYPNRRCQMRLCQLLPDNAPQPFFELLLPVMPQNCLHQQCSARSMAFALQNMPRLPLVGFVQVQIQMIMCSCHTAPFLHILPI